MADDDTLFDIKQLPFDSPLRRTPVQQAIDTIRTALRILEQMETGQQPIDRVDSVTWRLADTLLILGRWADTVWPGTETPGYNDPTGRGAMLTKEAAKVP